jgi:transcriptional regulator with XRE-family HTH domain
MKANNITQQKLSKILGMSQSNVSKALSLNDKKCFTLNQVVGIADHFGVSIGEPHEKWTALYSLSDKCRIAGGQNSSIKRTEILL